MLPARPKNSRFVTALFIALFLIATLLLLHLLTVYLAAIIMAGALATLFHPVFRRVCKYCGWRRRLAAGISTAMVVVVVMVPVSIVAASLWGELVRVYDQISSGEQPFTDKLVGLLDPDNPVLLRVQGSAAQMGVDLTPERIRVWAASTAAELARNLYDQLKGLAGNVVQMLMHFGLMVVLIFALFADGTRIKAYLLDLSPLPDNQEEKLVERFRGISRAVFLGNGVASGLQGLFGGLGFYFFGVGSGVLWGSAIAFFAFLPIVGATIVFIPAAIYLVAQGKLGLAVGFVIYNAIYVGLLEYGAKPRLIGGQSQMSGVLVFLGILAGLNLYGILGLFYGPLILTMFFAIADIYKLEYRTDLMSVLSPWVTHEGAAED